MFREHPWRWLTAVVAVGVAVSITALATRSDAGDGTAGGGAGDERSGDDKALSADERRTLDSLERLDDHPLYRMAWSGPVPKVRETAPGEDAAAAPREGRADTNRSPYACTVFVAAGDPAAKTPPLVGRNFDWDPNPALVLTTDPPDGYATVSVVDISYLGVDAAAADGLMSDPDRRRMLLDAPRLPFDGMNEHGVVVAMAADETGRAEDRDDRPTVGSVGVMRQVLESSRTVAEAVAALRRVNIDFDGGPPLHYLVADATGASAVVEFVDASTRVLPSTGGWQVLVNFTLATSTPAIQRDDRRYRTASDALRTARGAMTPAAAMSLLDRVQQGHTQWSAVYEPQAGTVRVATSRRYGAVHTVRIPGAG